MAFRFSLIFLLAVTLFGATSDQGMAQHGDGFWYPQPSYAPHYIQGQFPIEYELVAPSVYPYPQNAPINAIDAPHHIGPVEFPMGSVTLAPGEIIHGGFPIEPSTAPLVAPAAVIPHSTDIGIDNDSSPSDITIETLEQQALVENGSKILEIVGQIEGLEERVERNNDQTDARFDTLESTLKQSAVEIQNQLQSLELRIDSLVQEKSIESEEPILPDERDDQIAELKKQSQRLKNRLEKKLKQQAEQIDALTTKLRDLEAANLNQKANSEEAFNRLQVEYSRALEDYENQQKNKTNRARSNLDKKIEQIGKIIEQEVQESIREHRERIIRNVIRQATEELRKKKDRRKRRDEDECEDDDQP